MTRQIEAGSRWYVISMKWILSWQRYAYFDLLNDPTSQETPSTDRVHPGKITNSDILLDLPLK
jgi:hypothetical protein